MAGDRHSLPTPTSLARWNMKVSPSCPLCQHPSCTAKHVLSCCPLALQQGRYTWRHDNALKIIFHFLVDHHPNASIYCDLDGLGASANPPCTIPPETLSTSAHPDITIISSDSITLVELTVPWNSEDNLAQAKRRKSEKDDYQLVLSDLASLGLKASLITIEIGCLGHHLPHFFQSLKDAAPSSTKAERVSLRDKLSKSVISSSHMIFATHKNSIWNC